MPSGTKKVCLVTPAHLSYNPRLLKEADALHEAGYRVRVVTTQRVAALAAWDQSLMTNRSWCLETLNACPDNLVGRLTWLRAALRQRLHPQLPWLQQPDTRFEERFWRYSPDLSRLAARKPADLFIAHNLHGLPAAAYAARRWQAKLGFDAEDFHRGEIADDNAKRAPIRQLIMAIEEKYIPRCDYITAASDGIAEAYARTLNVPKPVTILNVFPLSERQGHTPAEELRGERRGSGMSLYWYSIVIGADRGLDDVLEAMSLVKGPIQLHLRGKWANGYETAFLSRAQALGVRRAVHVLPSAPPGQLVERAAQHDVGLALETGLTENRRIAVTNKLLNYLLAGLAVAATDVPGQRGILEEASGAGVLYPPGDASSLASRLSLWQKHPNLLEATKARSLRYGQERFCWDKEKPRLVKAVRAVCDSN
jgi:glycosyltransferase involved in cell wall biosynthesis